MFYLLKYCGESVPISIYKAVIISNKNSKFSKPHCDDYLAHCLFHLQQYKM